MTQPMPEEEPVALAAATVTVYPDGPLVLRGDFEVRDVDGAVLPTGRIVALCRCGRSAVKPLCDNSHQHRSRRAATDQAAEGRATEDRATTDRATEDRAVRDLTVSD